MIFRTTPRLATIGLRLRNAVLVLFTLFVAHDAIYVAHSASAPARVVVRGHDGSEVPRTRFGFALGAEGVSEGRATPSRIAVLGGSAAGAVLSGGRL